MSYANQGYTIRAASDITITASTYSFDTLSGDLEHDIYTAGDPYDYVVLTDIGQYTVQLLYGGDLLATDVVNLVPVTPMNLESLGLGTLFLLALGRAARRRHDPPSA